MTTNNRVIVGCTHGQDDPDRVVASYLTAGAALDQGNQVVMWLSSEGVRLALRGYVDPIREGRNPRSSASTTSSSRRAAASTCARSASRTATSTSTISSRTPSSKAPARSWSSPPPAPPPSPTERHARRIDDPPEADQGDRAGADAGDDRPGARQPCVLPGQRARTTRCCYSKPRKRDFPARDS
jgi:hypothetical protein